MMASKAFSLFNEKLLTNDAVIKAGEFYKMPTNLIINTLLQRIDLKRDFNDNIKKISINFLDKDSNIRFVDSMEFTRIEQTLDTPNMIIVIKYDKYDERVQVDSNFKLEDLFVIMATDKTYKGLDIFENGVTVYTTTVNLRKPKKGRSYTGKSEYFAFRDKPLKEFYKYVFNVGEAYQHDTLQDAINSQRHAKRIIRETLSESKHFNQNN